jgi:beta-fructofuranosidase
VSSPDLLHWRHHPVAFGPTPDGPDAFGCWSGVFLPGLDRPAVAYSGLCRATEDDPGGSTVCVRRTSPDDPGSLDRWDEPIVVARTPDVDGVRVMRDPFLFSHRGVSWALLGAGLHDGSPAVLLFDASDPDRWTYAGLFATGRDPLASGLPPADIWECPQLVRCGDAWLLVLSLQYQGRFGTVEGIVGDLADAGRPRFVAHGHARLDDGDSFYAPQALADGDGALMFGWIREAPQENPAARVAGCLTLPRRVTIVGDKVRVAPDPIVDAGFGPAELAGPDPERDGPPRACRLEPLSPGAMLEGAGRVVPLPVGCRVYLDGNVVEVYREAGVPATYRLTDEQGWRVRGYVRAHAWAGPSMPE